MDEALFNRCLWDVTGRAHEEYRRLGDNARGRIVRVAAAGSTQGHRWVGAHLSPREFWPVGNFQTYATRWEQRYSALTPNRSRLKFLPVVSDKSRLSANLPPQWGGTSSAFPAIAHYGSARVTDIIVPRKFATTAFGDARRKALEGLLDQGIEAYVEEGYPGGDRGPFSDADNLGPNYFTVLTDPDGRILACLDAYGSEAGLESEDPLSYLMVGSALLKLATAGGRVVFRMISQRAARKAAQRAAARATIRAESVTAEELTAIRGGAPAGKGPLMSAEVLNQPVGQSALGKGAKRMLTKAERLGVTEVIGVLERMRPSLEDLAPLRAIGRRVKPMQHGAYGRGGWLEIDALPGNPGAYNQIRVLVRVANGDFQVKLLQVH